MNRKSQMEMLGLALVVMLISIAMLFVVRFMVFDTPDEAKTDYTETELASNFISTLLETTASNCRDLTFTELFQDVASGMPPYSSCPEASKDTMQVLTESLTTILMNTFEIKGIGYEFNATTNGLNPVYVYHRGSCPGARTRRQFPIPVDASGAIILEVTLNICSKQYE